MRIYFAFVWITVFLDCLFSASAEALDIQFRRPIALASSGDGNWLYVANRDSGSLSVIDLRNQSVAKEVTVAGRLSDLARVDDQHLLVLDEKNHQLVMLTGEGADWKVVLRQNISPDPVRLKWAPGIGRGYVTSLWSRTVSAVEVSVLDSESLPRLTVAKTLELPFEPREMWLTKDETKLIVADAFRGTLAVIDAKSLKQIALRSVPGHNIRGLAQSADGKRLFVAQQELNPLARSTQDDVHWGNMLMNHLASLSLEDLCNPHPGGRIHRIALELGSPGRGAGDPGAIHILPSGKMAIALSGVNEIALAEPGNEFSLERIAVGRRPAAMTSIDGRLFVANMFSDSISIVDLGMPHQAAEISLGPTPELRPDQLGEMLFFDSRLSHDGWMSCHNCHTDGHSNGQLNDNLSDGSFGAPKRVQSLLGVGQTGPWAWNGEMKTLKQQVTSSIEKTMQGTTPPQSELDALVSYLETLSSPPAPLSRKEENPIAIAAGRELFQTLDCRRCHAPPLYTTPQIYDVGLKDAVGNRQFNPPSLRGIGRRPFLFHDGTAKSLEDVFVKHKHQVGRELSEEELERLLQFLRSL